VELAVPFEATFKFHTMLHIQLNVNSWTRMFWKSWYFLIKRKIRGWKVDLSDLILYG